MKRSLPLQFQKFDPKIATKAKPDQCSLYELCVLGKEGIVSSKPKVDNDNGNATYSELPEKCDSRDMYENMLSRLDSNHPSKLSSIHRSASKMNSRLTEKDPSSLEFSPGEKYLKDTDEIPTDWSLYGSCTIKSDTPDAFGWISTRSTSDWYDELQIDNNQSCGALFEYPTSQIPYDTLKIAATKPLEPVHSSFRYSGKTDMNSNVTVSDRPQQPNQEERALDGSLFQSNVQNTKTRKQQDDESISLSHFVFKQRSEWGIAFTSLFGLLKAKRCPYFYYVSIDHRGDTEWVSLFLAQDTLYDGSSMCVIMSRSTESFRQRLISQLVDFTTPFDTSVQQAECNVDIQDEFKELIRTQTSMTVQMQLSRAPSIVSDDNSKTLLTISGQQNTAGYHNLLLNHVVKRSGAFLLPKLLSPVLFEYGSTRSPIKSTPKRFNSKASPKPPNAIQFQTLHTLPSQLPQIARYFRRKNPQANIHLSVQPVDETVHFNRALNIVCQAQNMNFKAISRIESTTRNRFKVSFV